MQPRIMLVWNGNGDGGRASSQRRWKWHHPNNYKFYYLQWYQCRCVHVPAMPFNFFRVITAYLCHHHSWMSIHWMIMIINIQYQTNAYNDDSSRNNNNNHNNTETNILTYTCEKVMGRKKEKRKQQQPPPQKHNHKLKHSHNQHPWEWLIIVLYPSRDKFDGHKWKKRLRRIQVLRFDNRMSNGPSIENH